MSYVSYLWQRTRPLAEEIFMAKQQTDRRMGWRQSLLCRWEEDGRHVFLPSVPSGCGEELPQRQQQGLEHNRTLCRAGRGRRCEFVPISSSHEGAELASSSAAGERPPPGHGLSFKRKPLCVGGVTVLFRRTLTSARMRSGELGTLAELSVG